MARLAEAGASVLVVDVDSQAAESSVDEITRALPPGSQDRLAALGADVSDSGTAKQVVDACSARFGSVDILVNNAGIFPITLADTLTGRDWDRVLDLNLKGLFFYCQAAAQEMERRGGGKIINIASIAALVPEGDRVAYDASKAGVVMVTKALAREWGKKGIRVNAIAPGVIATPGMQEQASQRLGPQRNPLSSVERRFKSRIALGGFGKPDHVATVALFLARIHRRRASG